MIRNWIAASCLIAGVAALGTPARAAEKALPTIVPGQWHGPPLGRPAPGNVLPGQLPEVAPGHPMPRTDRRRYYHRRYRPAPPIRERPRHGGRIVPGPEHRIPRVPPAPEHHIPRVLPR